jgi:hypothetical protein
MHLPKPSIMSSKLFSKLARWWAATASLSSLNHQLPSYLQTRLIMASKYISNITRLWAASYSLSFSISQSKFISKVAHSRLPSASLSSAFSRTPSASLSSLNHSLPLHLQSRAIMAYKWVTKLAQSRCPSVSLSSLNQSLLVLLWGHSCTICSQIDRIGIFTETYIDYTCHIIMKQIFWL